MIYVCTTFGLFVVFPWGILPRQSDLSLSCDHGLDYASYCESNNKADSRFHFLYVFGGGMNCVSCDICVCHFCFDCVFFPGVFLYSRVTGACPVTTDLTMRVNVRITTTLVPKCFFFPEFFPKNN